MRDCGTSRFVGLRPPPPLLIPAHFSSALPSQVAAEASSLNSNDVFVLKWPKGTFVWKGRGATPEELAAAKHVVGVLGGGTPAEVAETKEPGQRHASTARCVAAMCAVVPLN